MRDSQADSAGSIPVTRSTPLQQPFAECRACSLQKCAGTGVSPHAAWARRGCPEARGGHSGPYDYRTESAQAQARLQRVVRAAARHPDRVPALRTPGGLPQVQPLASATGRRWGTAKRRRPGRRRTPLAPPCPGSVAGSAAALQPQMQNASDQTVRGALCVGGRRTDSQERGCDGRGAHEHLQRYHRKMVGRLTGEAFARDAPVSLLPCCCWSCTGADSGRQGCQAAGVIAESGDDLGRYQCAITLHGVFADCGGTLRRITTSGGVVHTQASSADRPATSRSGRGDGRVAPPGAAQGVGDEPGR